jgi:transposase
VIYVGIDLHRKRSHVAAVDERGVQVLSRRIANDADVFEAVIAELEGEAKFALEATYGWEWLAQLLEDRGCELHLAHPLRTKAIASARVKTDAVDARTLAHLLRADLLPEAYIAPRELRDLRDLLRQRVVLTHMRTALKNRVHALIARQGILRQHTDLFGAGGRRFLAELRLRPEPRRRLDVLLRLVDDFDREIAALSAEIDARAKDDPRVDVLRQIRGIGRYIGLLIVAEIGDIERFPTARHLCAWAGLTPTVRSSDAKARLGHISGMGIHRAALGAGRGRPEDLPGRRPAARLLRAHRQAPRPPDRQGRDRAQDPHPLLLRTARRRDPRPQSPRPGGRDESHGALMRAAAHLPAPRAGNPSNLAHARASSLLCLASTHSGRPPS